MTIACHSGWWGRRRNRLRSRRWNRRRGQRLDGRRGGRRRRNRTGLSRSWFRLVRWSRWLVSIHAWVASKNDRGAHCDQCRKPGVHIGLSVFSRRAAHLLGTGRLQRAGLASAYTLCLGRRNDGRRVLNGSSVVVSMDWIAAPRHEGFSPSLSVGMRLIHRWAVWCKSDTCASHDASLMAVKSSSSSNGFCRQA